MKTLAPSESEQMKKMYITREVRNRESLSNFSLKKQIFGRIRELSVYQYQAAKCRRKNNYVKENRGTGKLTLLL